jgi:putative membrane protein
MMTGMGFGFGGFFLMILFWISIIAGAVWIVKLIFTGTTGTLMPPGKSRGSSAREILDQRYAKGEMSREDYELMKQDLSEA